MLKRLALTLFAILILTGCAEKNIQTNTLSETTGYTVSIPRHWAPISKKQLTDSSASLKELVESDKMTFDGAYTGHTSGALKTPVVVFTHKDLGKATEADIQEIQNIFVKKMISDPGVSMKSRTYDPARKRFHAEFVYTNGMTKTLMPFILQYTETGIISAVGIANPRSPLGRNAIKDIFDSLVVHPENVHR